jgi:hypothetical protein
MNAEPALFNDVLNLGESILAGVAYLKGTPGPVATSIY